MGITKHNYKLTDEQFIEAYKECKGNFSQTSQHILLKYGIPYSKQAVYKRAQNFPEETEKIVDGLSRHCSLHLAPFADDENVDVKLRIKIYLHMLDKISKCQLMYIKARANKSLNKTRRKLR